MELTEVVKKDNKQRRDELRFLMEEKSDRVTKIECEVVLRGYRCARKGIRNALYLCRSSPINPPERT